MIQLRPGDLVAVRKDEAYFGFAILTKQTLLGGHWCFVFHGSRPAPSLAPDEMSGGGFNAFVDFIVPKREDRIVRLSRGNELSALQGPELLQQAPSAGAINYRIWRWKDGKREEAEYVRFTLSPTPAERRAPRYSCMPADFACDLAARKWTEDADLWGA